MRGSHDSAHVPDRRSASFGAYSVTQMTFSEKLTPREGDFGLALRRGHETRAEHQGPSSMKTE